MNEASCTAAAYVGSAIEMVRSGTDTVASEPISWVVVLRVVADADRSERYRSRRAAGSRRPTRKEPAAVESASDNEVSTAWAATIRGSADCAACVVDA